MVSKTVKADNLKELIEEMHADPGKYSFGGGNGRRRTCRRLDEQAEAADADARPYRGGAQGINDVIGGHIDMFYGGVTAGKPGSTAAASGRSW